MGGKKEIKEIFIHWHTQNRSGAGRRLMMIDDDDDEDDDNELLEGYSGLMPPVFEKNCNR
jgi:hypothetical protein